MIKLSRLACYGVVILAEMSDGNELRTASDLAEKTGLPEPTVAKALKLLSKDGFLKSSRGVRGGYTLEKSPENISIADIVTAMDGPIALTGCVDGKQENCRLEGICALRGCWDDINHAVRAALESQKLSSVLARRRYGDADIASFMQAE